MFDLHNFYTEPMGPVLQLGVFMQARILWEAAANTSRTLGVVHSLLLGDAISHGLYLIAFPQVE